MRKARRRKICRASDRHRSTAFSAFSSRSYSSLQCAAGSIEDQDPPGNSSRADPTAKEERGNQVITLFAYDDDEEDDVDDDAADDAHSLDSVLLAPHRSRFALGRRDVRDQDRNETGLRYPTGGGGGGGSWTSVCPSLPQRASERASEAANGAWNP